MKNFRDLGGNKTEDGRTVRRDYFIGLQNYQI